MIFNWTSLSYNIISQAPHYALGLDSSVITSRNNELEVMHYHALKPSSNLLLSRYIVSSVVQSEVHINSLVRFSFWKEPFYIYIMTSFWLGPLQVKTLSWILLIFHYYLLPTLSHEKQGYLVPAWLVQSAWNTVCFSCIAFKFRNCPVLHCLDGDFQTIFIMQGIKMAYLLLSTFYLDHNQFSSIHFAVRMTIHADETIETIVNMSGKMNVQICSKSNAICFQDNHNER